MAHSRNFKVLICGFCLAAGRAWGGNSDGALPHLETPSLTFSLVRVMGALAVVFALFLGGAWLFRNWQRLTIQRGRAPKLNVLELKSLGPRHALYVVGYEQQRFLLSSAPTGITLLATLPPGSEMTGEPTPQRSFAENLAAALLRGKGAAGGLK